MKKSKLNAIIKHLERTRSLEYGRILSQEYLEELFGAKFEEGWAFLGPYLTLKEALTELGYFSKSNDDFPGALFLLSVEEMAHKGLCIYKSIVKRLKLIQSGLSNAKIQDLNNSELRRHMHTASLVSTGLNALTSKVTQIAVMYKPEDDVVEDSRDEDAEIEEPVVTREIPENTRAYAYAAASGLRGYG